MQPKIDMQKTFSRPYSETPKISSDLFPAKSFCVIVINPMSRCVPPATGQQRYVQVRVSAVEPQIYKRGTRSSSSK